MAKKRALVDAALGLGCMAELFTQDIEPDETHGDEPAAPPAKKPEPVTLAGKPLPADSSIQVEAQAMAKWLASNPPMDLIADKVATLANLRKSNPPAFSACRSMVITHCQGCWEKWLATNPAPVTEMNCTIPILALVREANEPAFHWLWKKTTSYTTKQGWRYNQPTKTFVTFAARAATAAASLDKAKQNMEDMLAKVPPAEDIFSQTPPPEDIPS
jgi:hypothetical protein